MSKTFELEHLISERAKARTDGLFTVSSAQGAPAGFQRHPQLIPLHWGMPNEGFFPIESIELNLVDYPFQKSSAYSITNGSLESLIPPAGSKNGFQRSGPEFQNSMDSLRRLNIKDEKLGSNKITVPKHSENANLIDLAQGLQYTDFEGIKQLINFTKDLITRTHKPGYEDWDSIMTCGAGDGLFKAADVLFNEGDVVLVEEFTFPPFLKNVVNNGAVAVPVKLDLNTEPGKSCGIDLDYLTQLLENWDELQPELKNRKIKALYTIPTGHNPTGLTQTLEFRKKVYALAEKYDFAIIEDDPYGYLSLPPYHAPEGVLKLDEFLTVDEYLSNHLAPSYLTIDTKGRVLRIESFSKVFAPGLRLGFIVAHKSFIEQISKYISVKPPSGASQILLNNVIEQKFGGVDGWLQWVLKVRATYSHRRDVLLHALYKLEAFKQGYMLIIDPKAGMFVSVIINLPQDVNYEEKLTLLNWKFAAFGVGVVPGSNMAVDKLFSKNSLNFFRLTYACAKDDNELREAGTRFGNAVTDFFNKGLEF